MKEEALSISHWKVQQRLREARAREARNGKLATFGTLIASSPVLSKLAKELDARDGLVRGAERRSSGIADPDESAPIPRSRNEPIGALP